MGLFEPISKKDEKEGLVFHKVYGKHLVELQTGVIPNVLHLVVFDVDTLEPVADRIGAYEFGQSLEDNMETLQAEIKSILSTINKK